MGTSLTMTALFNINLILDPAVLLCYSRTGRRRHRARAGNQTLQGAELHLVSRFITEIFYRQKLLRPSGWSFQKGILSVLLQWPVYTVLIWNLYRHVMKRKKVKRPAHTDFRLSVIRLWILIQRLTLTETQSLKHTEEKIRIDKKQASNNQERISTTPRP